MAIDLGQVRRWKEGHILFAENDLIRMAYAVTDDPKRIGTGGWSNPTDDAIWVEWIDAETAKFWPDDGE
jgi:hypothetical protein